MAGATPSPPRRMSLKNRLRVSIVTLVTLLVFAQCVVSLRITAESSFQAALERAQSMAVQVRNLVIQRVNEQTANSFPPPSNLEESKALWERILVSDPALPPLLEATAATSLPVLEILVCNQAGKILTASIAGRARTTFPSLPDFAEWNQRLLWDRLFEVLWGNKDYSLVVPLAATGESRPTFTIRVHISSVFLGAAILPQVRSLAIVSVLSMLASMILAAMFSNVMLRALDRISHHIDLITTGQFAEAGQAGGEAREFAAVQSKLAVLSDQFRGAREDVVQLRTNIEQMLDRLEEAVLLFDPEHRLILASRAAESLLGRRVADIAGRPLAEVLPPDTPIGAAVQEAVAHQKPIQSRLLQLQRDGASWRLLVSVELLRGVPGDRFGTLITLQDAETRRQLHSQLDISTRLAAISRLTGGVAHEIKNPLNAMALHLEILRSKLDEPGVATELDVIGREIARLDRVVKTFLDFTRPIELQMRDVNVVELARDIATLVKPDAQRGNIIFDLIAPDEECVIRGDRDLLKQCILNVVGNGIEAMPQGGRLSLRVARESEEVVITIADEGTGIPPALRDKIFNLYFSTKEKGSGIGLAMTFRVVQLHNAAIDFTSELGRGATFFLRFPAGVAEATPARRVQS